MLARYKKSANTHIIIVVLILNTILPAFASADSSQLGNKVLLCTSKGYQWVSIDSSHINQDSGKQHQQCVFCLNTDDVEFAVKANTNSNFLLQNQIYDQISANLVAKLPPVPSAQSPPITL